MNKGCFISLGALVVLLTAALIFYFSQQTNEATEGTKTEKPKITDIIKKTVATGSIKPRQEVQVKPQVSGVVDVLYVEAGELVEKGQKLAKIKLVPSEVNVNNARNSVELARIRLDEAKRELARQKEVYDRQLDLEAAKVSYEDAKREEKRQRQLFEDGIISEQNYNTFKVALELRQAEYENAGIIARNNLKQFETNVDIREQELQAAINNLQLLQEGATRNSSQVSNVVVSTVNGMVLEVPVEEGTSVIERNNFNEGTSIAVVADMNSLIFEGKVDESDVGKLREGMPIELTVGAIEDEKFAATLEYISPKGVTEEGTVKFTVRAAVKPTKDVFLRAGYSANGDIILDARKNVVAIQERDVIYEEDSTFVRLKKSQDGSFEKVPVKLGLSDGISVEVLGGVDTTSRVMVLQGGG